MGGLPEVGHQQASSSLHNQQPLLAESRPVICLAVLSHLWKLGRQWLAVRMFLQPSCGCKASQSAHTWQRPPDSVGLQLEELSEGWAPVQV